MTRAVVLLFLYFSVDCRLCRTMLVIAWTHMLVLAVDTEDIVKNCLHLNIVL